MQKSESEVNLQPQVLATESDMPEITEEKPIVSKVDPETLKKRMEEDKEINALNEEKDRIIGLIEEYKDAYYDEEEFRKEAYNMTQCHDPHKYRKRIVGFILLEIQDFSHSLIGRLFKFRFPEYDFLVKVSPV